MSEKTKVRSAEEVRRRGIEALAEALRPVDAVRFLQSFDLGSGDSTEAHAWCWAAARAGLCLALAWRKTPPIDIASNPAPRIVPVRWIPVDFPLCRSVKTTNH